MLVVTPVLKHVEDDVAASRRTSAAGQEEQEEISKSLLHLRLCSLSLMKTDFCQAWRRFHQAEGGDWSLSPVRVGIMMAPGSRRLPPPASVGHSRRLSDTDPPSLRVFASHTHWCGTHTLTGVAAPHSQCC